MYPRKGCIAAFEKACNFTFFVSQKRVEKNDRLWHRYLTPSWTPL